MIELGIQERSAISALQWLPVEGIRAQYAEYLKDYCGCAMIPTYSGKKVPGRGTFHYYRCNNTHKHVTEVCQLKNISGAAIEEPIFNLVEKLITNEYFLNLVSDPEEVAELRKLAANKVSLIKTMTRVELRRLAQIFIREVKVRKDGIDLVVRGDGFKKLMGKE